MTRPLRWLIVGALLVLLAFLSAPAGAWGPSPEPSPPPSPEATATPSSAPSQSVDPEDCAGGAPCDDADATGEASPGSFEETGVEETGDGADARGGSGDEASRVPADAPAPSAKTIAGSASVSAQDNFFSPAALTVDAGTTVIWTNDGANPHTVTADDGSFDSGTLAPGETFSLTPGQAGQIPYFCTFHGAPGGVGMAGVLDVQGAAAPAALEEDGEEAAPAPTPGAGDDALAATGLDSLPLAGAGLLLVAAGAVLLRAVRRRDEEVRT